MKSVGQLKEDILDNKLEKFYIFYGEDYGIRQHYINKLSTFFTNKPIVTYDYKTIKVSNKMQTLFGSNEKLVIVYDDREFAMLEMSEIQKFIGGLEEYTCIFVYEEPIAKSPLFEYFENYITNFSLVKDKIGEEFVKGLISVDVGDVSSLAYNCHNNYNNILLECDKIVSYANAKNISQQSAYDVLDVKNQLLERIGDYDANAFMNDVLQHKKDNYAYWYEVLNNNIDKFYASLTFIFNDYLIAGVLSHYRNDRNRSSIAFNLKLNWVRIKTIRDFDLDLEPDEYFNCAFKIADIDGNIKLGRLNKEQLVDTFFNNVI